MTKPPSCTNNTPPGFVGHWRDWHRGHGCDKDDNLPRTAAATTEIAQIAENAATGYLTDAELSFLRASTTSGNTLLVRALDELTARRAAVVAAAAAAKRAPFDHSAGTVKQFEPLLGFCTCIHCTKLPAHQPAPKVHAP